MLRVKRWTDEWAAGLPHPAPGKPEVVYNDPSLSKHRLVVKTRTKVYEIQMERPKQFGPRKTYVKQTGTVPGTTLADARDKATHFMALIREGKDPHDRPPVNGWTTPESAGTAAIATLAWTMADYESRPELEASTLRNAKHIYKRFLAKWGSMDLAALVEEPITVRDEHRRITKDNGPYAADNAMKLLRTLYRHAAKLNTKLRGDRNPCSAVVWNGGKPREGAAIPAEHMPVWKAELEALRAKSPIRAGHQMLCLRLGLRPGELGKATWSEVDLERRVLTIPVSKTELIESPLTDQSIAEFEALRDARVLNAKGNDFIFPARMGKHGTGYLTRLTDDALSYSGNCGRHSHHTIGALVGTGLGLSASAEEMTLDVLEGRSLLKSGSAGRGYLERSEFGPYARVLQQRINDEIDRLFAGEDATAAKISKGRARKS